MNAQCHGHLCRQLFIAWWLFRPKLEFVIDCSIPVAPAKRARIKISQPKRTSSNSVIVPAFPGCWPTFTDASGLRFAPSGQGQGSPLCCPGLALVYWGHLKGHELERMDSDVSQEVFRNPVIAKDGRTFERAALLSWWSSHETFPYSRNVAYDRSLVPNASLRAAITALYGIVPVRPQPLGLRT